MIPHLYQHSALICIIVLACTCGSLLYIRFVWPNIPAFKFLLATNTEKLKRSGGYRFWGGGGARMVGVAGGGVGFWPDTKSGGGGGGAVGLWPDTRSGGGGGGGCCRILAQNEERGGGGGGVLSVSGPIRRAGGGGSMIAYRGARDIVQ